MHCNTLIDPVCRAVGHLVQTATGSVAGDVLGGIAQAISGGVRWIVENTATWWVRIPSPNLATEPAVTHLRQWLLPVTVAAATTLGTIVPALLLQAGDAWSTWVLQVSTGGQFAARLTTVLVLGNNAAPAVIGRASCRERV